MGGILKCKIFYAEQSQTHPSLYCTAKHDLPTCNNDNARMCNGWAIVSRELAEKGRWGGEGRKEENKCKAKT